jgi:hypothetical protein
MRAKRPIKTLPTLAEAGSFIAALVVGTELLEEACAVEEPEEAAAVLLEEPPELVAVLAPDVPDADADVPVAAGGADSS